MKTISMICLTVLLASANAQTRHRNQDRVHAEKSPAERATHEAQKMSNELALTPDQRTQWEAAATERIEASKPLRKEMREANTESEKQAIHEKMRAHAKVFRDKVNAFLTPEQKEKFRQMKSERRGRRGGTNNRNHPATDTGD